MCEKKSHKDTNNFIAVLNKTEDIFKDGIVTSNIPNDDSPLIEIPKVELSYTDLARWYAANAGERRVQKDMSKSTYVAVAYKNLGFIVDIVKEKIVGFVDADIVDFVNEWSLFANRKESQVNRFGATITVEGVGVSIPLSHVVFCRNYEMFSTQKFEIHHIKNACDNRVSLLQKVKKHQNHPPQIVNSQEYISNVIREMGEDEDLFTFDVVQLALKKKKNVV